ncbi:mutants block sporulation after engulfment (stage III sporulation) [Paenibacillus sp. PK3_47]|uniref:SpoIIIAH-like family protein n=1 Tax=Paenibacillus sp. PK3_47 TaxID=2072642 RepID=UPI00201D39C7|nr:SpoIIIAH-like family protein [Paenibacillus sp. PK3_47]UQZ32544.1 mutants block sporulation after engulfment (stage III sporulation) [Paenibacillus sp. PK3_47]
MKGKRQTIWLVSMLSLMVVLSAYYLFTEDSGTSIPQETAGSIQVDTVKDGAGNSDAAVLDSGLVINEVDTQDALTTDADTEAAAVTGESSDNTAAEDSSAAAVTEDPAAAVTEDSSAASDGSTEADSSTTADSGAAAGSKDTAAADTNTGKPAATDSGSAAADKDSSAAADAEEPAKGDEEILKEVAAQSASASSLFNNYEYEREQQNLKNYNDLLAQINDMEKTPAENAAAHEQLSKLEEKESKISDIEVKLQQKYGEAIVKEETGNAYTVVVMSEKLDVKQAVGIVDMVMKELSVTQDKIRVQYVSAQ